jgi:hypothetical protein
MATEATNNGWHLSRTVWVNIIAAITAVLPLFDMNLLTTIGISNSAKWLAIIGVITTVFNVINRIFFPDTAKPDANA